MNVHSITPTAAAATAAITDDEITDLDLTPAIEAEEAKMREPKKAEPAKSNTVLKKGTTDQKPVAEIYKEGDRVFISPTLQRDMDAAAKEIRKLRGGEIKCTLQMGAHLSVMKDRLKHGEFGRWWQREFPWLDAMGVSRAMRANSAWTAIRELEPSAKIDLLPPTLLYGFDKLSDDQQLEIVDAAKAGTKLKVGDFKKPKTGSVSKAASPSSTEVTNAQELVKLIVDNLSYGVRAKIVKHSGFNALGFGKLLQKEIDGSFGEPFEKAA